MNENCKCNNPLMDEDMLIWLQHTDAVGVYKLC